jgi:hypothetical protein
MAAVIFALLFAPLLPTPTPMWPFMVSWVIATVFRAKILAYQYRWARLNLLERLFLVNRHNTSLQFNHAFD